MGGGVAGLTTAMLLRRSGIDCVVLERQSRAYVEQRQRAGLVEYRGVRMFTEWGLGDLLGTFPADNTMEVRVDGEPVFIGRDAHAQEYVGVLVRLRSQVFEPMSYGRLYLLGDAAHVISPMGAKGMNLALYDAETFVNAARDHVQAGDDSGLRAYSGTCLARTWRYQEYADWWSQTFFSRCGQHAAADPYAARVAEARLARFTEPSSAAALAWGELMTGLA